MMPVVVEYIRHTVRGAESARLEEAYRRAAQVLSGDPHCLRHEVRSDGADE
jgi:hypothetical protein